MKKYLLVLIVAFMMLTPKVKAVSTGLNLDYSLHYLGMQNYSDFKDFINFEHNKKIYTNLYNDLINKYNSDYKTEYPYYVLQIQYNLNTDDGATYSLIMQLFKKSVYVFYDNSDTLPSYSSRYSDDNNYVTSDDRVYLSTAYVEKSKTYITPGFSSSGNDFSHYSFAINYDGIGKFFESFMISSNFDIKIKFNNPEDKLTINNFRDVGTLILHNDDVIPMLSIFGDETDNYKTINLNDYAYIALFLKDYSKAKAFSTTTYVKGQSCITPLYNFSTSLKPDKSENICSPVYSDYTASDIYVLKSDIENKAVYYVSKYDSSIENSIKIDTSVFDIFYVKEEDAANPTFNYKGNEYAGIGLDNVDYSANKNTENGLVPGESKNVADTFADVIKKPLELFKNISSGLTSFFSLITSFLGFLPTELQGFLYFSFVVAIVLGIIKIIL